MWGSAFSDLARKAQELQEQAQEAAHSFAVPTTAATSLFNLDAMRQQVEESATTPPSSSLTSSSQQPRATRDVPVDVPVAPAPNRGLVDHRLWAAASPAAAAAPRSRPIPATGGAKLKVPSSPPAARPVLAKGPPDNASKATPAEAGAENGVPQPTGDAAEDAAAMAPDATESGDGTSSAGDSTTAAEAPNEDSQRAPSSPLGEVADATSETEAGAHLESTPPSSHWQNAFVGSPDADLPVVEEAIVEDTSDAGSVAGANIKSEESQFTTSPNAEKVAADREIHVNPGMDGQVQSTATGLPAAVPLTVDPTPVGGATEERGETADCSGESADRSREPKPTPHGDRSTTPPPVRMNRSADDSASPAATAGERQLPEGAVREHLLEQFSRQLQRLEDNFQAERLETQQRHEQEILQLQNHDACQAAQQDLEQRLQAELQQKDDQLQELARRNEGLKLKMDVLKREVAGTQQLLEAKDGDMGKVSGEHRAALKALEQQVQEALGKAGASQREVDRLQSKLESAETDLERLRHEHTDLKARVKTVATELKDRRVECRELKSTVDEQRDKNAQLEGELERLRFQLSEREKSRDEKEEEMEQLRAQLVDLKLALDKAEKQVTEHDAQSEKVLAEYKRKAQNSLALANSRAAAAAQAKEEAELDARAARSTADSAMERAVAAELSSKAAVAEAKALVKQMEQEKNEAVLSLTSANHRVEHLELTLSEMESKLKSATERLGQTTSDCKAASEQLREANTRIAVLESDLEQSHARSNVLRQDIATLREQLLRAETERDSPAIHEQEAPAKPDSSREQVASSSSDDATIRILQEDLLEANSAIEALKEALANSLALNEKYERSGGMGAADNAPSGSLGPRLENGDSSSTPLFYAMEKQAELNTARDEIMRLANLLSNVQSEKMEALELKEEMRQQMEEAEARLLRYEKLAGLHSSGNSSNGTTKDSSAVNIEYLKNIMLRYLNAKTLSEKKALVPVIGAVLCLTPDEQNNAVRCLEESASLGGVGSTLFDTFSVKLR